MTPGTAQRADAVRNRRAILDAAGRLLLEHGDLSMTDLARTAGVTRPTVYRHFRRTVGTTPARFASGR